MTSKTQYGVNLNSHPDAASWGRPADAQAFSGLQWVRFVFFLRGAVSGPEQTNIFGYDYLNQPLNYEEPLRRAFEYYDPIIDAYSTLGVRTLLVLIQDSFGGNTPWHPGSDGNWSTFAHNYGVFCGQLAAHYRGKGVAYEIWNEGDIPPHPQSSSIFITPEHYAPLLQSAAEQIKANDPQAQVILGGLATGAENGVLYLQQVRQFLPGRLPVDAIGVHPYGQFPPSGPKPHLGLTFGRLDEDLIQIYLEHFPGHQLWFTEFGVAADQPFPKEHWNDIADYMEESFDLIQRRYSEQIPVVMWWSWSDQMRQGGLVDQAGQRKQPIYSGLFRLAVASVESTHTMIAVASNAESPAALFVTPVDDGIPTRIRSRGDAESPIVGEASHGELLEVLEEIQEAEQKIGQRGEWLHVRTSDGIEGFIAAWFVEHLPQLPFTVPKEPLRGQERALEFTHAPEFVQLPVQVQVQDIIYFNGFGPNNFAYNDHVSQSGIYKGCFGIHNGLDFGVPHGTPLCAVDWGLVLHCSNGADDSDIPFRVGPRSVAILYGKYLCIYGHMSKTDEVRPGDIVKPGDRIGLSGTAFSSPHLHFELRELNRSYLQRMKAQIQADTVAVVQTWTQTDLIALRAAAKNYHNGAYFFQTPLEAHQWTPGKRLLNLDRDNNGYPDRVILADGTMPAFDLYWGDHYGIGAAGSFWQGCQELQA